VFSLVVRFDLRTEADAAQFDDLVTRTLAAIMAEEPGTLVYSVNRVTGSPLARVFFEVYADEDAFNAHEAQAHTRKFLAEREQYLAGVRVEFLSPVAAKGLAP
jgi:quinol monooxygenase YgiN